MRRNWILPLGLAATTALGALSLPALAHEVERGDGPGRGHGQSGEHGRGAGAAGGHGGMMDMMRQMHGMHSGMMGGSGAMMGGAGMMDEAGGPGHMGVMMRAFDADGDGNLTPDELRSGLEDRLAEFDADDSGTLSLKEFEALHSAMIRESMVDRFQMLDNDGDGEVTGEEMTAPADRMQRMQEQRSRMMEQRSGATGAGGSRATMPMDGTDGTDGMMEGAAGDGTEEQDTSPE